MDNYSCGWLGFYIGVIFTCILAVIIILAFNKKGPTALDVYRSKTTLEITYKDGVPIDSVVVFK